MEAGMPRMESEKAPCPNEIGEKARGSRSIQTALGARNRNPSLDAYKAS